MIALGGGGYDVRNVAKAWTIAWSILNGVELAGELPEAFSPDIKQFGFESRQLWDPPAAIPEDIGRAVQNYVDRQVDSVQKTIFPFHRL